MRNILPRDRDARSIMNKIVQLDIDDIVLDPAAMGEMLTDCLKRRRMVALAGACDIGGMLIVSFEDAPVRVKSEIVFAPFSDTSSDGVSAEIVSRYNSGFSLRASFRHGETVWGLFEHSES